MKKLFSFMITLIILSWMIGIINADAQNNISLRQPKQIKKPEHITFSKDEIQRMSGRAISTPVTLNIQESFENGFPSPGWTNTSPNGDNCLWALFQQGVNPSCMPQDGNNMIRFNSYSLANNYKGRLTSPSFYTNGSNQVLSFWVFRDEMMPGQADYLLVYLTEDGNVDNAAALLQINRNYSLPPIEQEPGWHNYIVLLPCAAMETAMVTIEGVSGYGNNIFIDNITIGDICTPPRNIKAVLSGETFPYKNVLVRWDAAYAANTLTGYNIYRNGVKIVNNLNALSYLDGNLATGNYFYEVEAVYNNHCGLSEKAAIEKPVTISDLAPELPAPEVITVDLAVSSLTDVNLFWNNPLGKLAYNFNDIREGGVGSEEDFTIAIRYPAKEMEPFDGLPITKFSFVPREVGCNYVLKIWTGGSEGNQGTEVYSQTISSSELNIGYEENVVTLATPYIIDARRELWIGIFYEGSKGFPAGTDRGPITRPGYSNLCYFNGSWLPANFINTTITYNWQLAAYVDMGIEGEEVLGFNVYREGSGLNTGLVETGNYADNVPSEGTYTYEVSAVYEGLRESAERAAITITMDNIPNCDEPSRIPLTEGFEITTFPPACWEAWNETGIDAWTRVMTGTNPVCSPHSGNAMIQFNSGNLAMMNQKGRLISPQIPTDKNYILSFWFYKDSRSPTRLDKIDIFLSDSPSVSGAELLQTFYRNTTLAPVEAETGWYQYKINLNLEEMETAYVIFEGFASLFGCYIYMDDIAFYDPDQLYPISVLKSMQPEEGTIVFSWEAPYSEGIIDYTILRDGIVIADHLTERTFTDYTTVGQHEYNFLANYATTSVPYVASFNIIGLCLPVLDLSLALNGPHSILLEWTPPADVINIDYYAVYCDRTYIGQTTESYFIDENAPEGDHTYSVEVFYTDKQCLSSERTATESIRIEYCRPITNLEAVAETNSTTLTWNYGGAAGFTDQVLYENFKNRIPGTWLNIDNDGDGYKWGTFTDSDRICAVSDSYADGNGLAPDNWLITNKITLFSSVVLNYDVRTMNPSYPADHYGVYISTTGTDLSNFTLLFEETLTGSMGSQWWPREIDLSQYSGDVYIAFRHFDCINELAVGISEVKVTAFTSRLFEIYKNDIFLAKTDATTYTDYGTIAGAINNYCVRPVFNTCTMDFECIRTNLFCNAPTNLIATQEAYTMKLTWSESGGATSFNIYRDNELIASEINATNYIDEDYASGNHIWCVETVCAEYELTSNLACVSKDWKEVYIINASASVEGTISPDGEVMVLRGNNQTFSIAANVGYAIDQVLVDGVNIPAAVNNGTYTFTNVRAPHTISATFVQAQYTITATAGEGGSITPSGIVGAAHGDTKTFFIVPNAGYKITQVLVDGIPNQEAMSGSYTFYNITTSHTISATFEHAYSVITATAGEGGSVTPTGATQVLYGQSRHYTITPHFGYKIATVLVDGTNNAAAVENGSYLFVNVTSDHSIAATFERIPHTIISEAGTGGSISPSGSTQVADGGTQTYTITVKEGYTLTKVLVDGINNEAAVAAKTYTFSNVTENHTIRAFFEISKYTIEATAGENGIIAPTGTITVNYGGSKTYTFTPNAGYVIDKVLIDGTNNATAVTEGTYSFEDVKDNHTIEVSFKVTTSTITATVEGGNGTIDPEGETTVDYGASQIYTFTPNEGYGIAEVLVDGVSKPGAVQNGSYTFNNVTTDHEIVVKFSEKTAIDEGEMVTLKVYPNPTSGQLRITNYELKIENVLVFDITGRLVLEVNNVDNHEASIDLSNHADGVYFIKVGEQTVKVVRR